MLLTAVCQAAPKSGYADLRTHVLLDANWRFLRIDDNSASKASGSVQNVAKPGGINGDVAGDSGLVATPDEAAPTFDDHLWRTVHLPHDYIVEGTFSQSADRGHGYLPFYDAWYRKTFAVPSSLAGKDLWLDFDGVYRNCKVWVNGTYVGGHECGYTGFHFDITSAIKLGAPNNITVFVNARNVEGWWYEGGGIYRHVWLTAVSPVHVAQYGAFVTSTIAGLGTGTPTATIKVQSTIENTASTPKTCTVVSTIVRPNGKPLPALSSNVTVPSGKTVELSQTAPEPDPALWSLETPRLYHLHTVVVMNGAKIDTLDTPFGVRSIRFDVNKGFLLNEKPVKIKGTCNHQDFAGVGIAIPDGILGWRVHKLLEMGSNAYRTSHNEVTSALLDACDQQGMLVMDEQRHLGDGEYGKSPGSNTADDLSNLRQQIMRDRNHPSIILWSMCNEEGLQGSDKGVELITKMKALTYALDGTRPITAAMNGGVGSGFSNVVDVQGTNYQIGSYDGFHTSHPNTPEMGSETCSAVATRGVYANDRENGWVSDYDTEVGGGWASTAENAWKPIAERDYVAGGFVWTGFDYRGEPNPYNWPCINSAFGIMDMCGFPKDTYYYYQAWWGNKPVTHVFPHWNWTGKEGQPIDVWAFSNADRVELFLNGTSQGSKDVPKNGHVTWTVPYVPGTLVAKGYSGNAVVSTDTVSTTGAPAALKLITDRPTIAADAEDGSPIEVDVVDSQGRVVPSATNLVQFNVTGPGIVLGVANGNPSSHEPDKASQRMAFNGKCMVIAGSTDKPGTMTVTAMSSGLAPATIKITTK
jgi:beta-galactosidase